MPMQGPIAAAQQKSPTGQLKTPTGQTRTPGAPTPAGGASALAPSGPTTPRPYNPTYTPSTIASAASEVMVQPPEPPRPGSVRNALILTIVGMVVFVSVAS